MLDGLRHLFSSRPLDQVLRDLVDIFIVAYVIYRALLVLRGTRAMQMGLGLGIVGLVYLGAKVFKLVTLLNLLSWLLSSIILIVVVVFQNDIRRALIRVGGKAWFSGGREQQSRVIDEVVAAATELARHRMGALIAFEQDANLLEFVKSEGISIESLVTRELLVSLFVPESVNKLHDGAVLIRDLKIARAGVFFPMPDTKILDASLGSRHRAALGITEETDAVVVVVSEERGTISFCFSGNIVTNLDGQSLRQALLGLFGRASRAKKAAAPASAPAPVKKVGAVSTTTMRTPTIPPPPPAVRPASAVTTTLSREGGLPREALITRDGGLAREGGIARDRDQPPVSQRAPISKVMTSTPMRPASEQRSSANETRGSGAESIRPGALVAPAAPAAITAAETPAEKVKLTDSSPTGPTGSTGPAAAITPRATTFVPTTPSTPPPPPVAPGSPPTPASSPSPSSLPARASSPPPAGDEP